MKKKHIKEAENLDAFILTESPFFHWQDFKRLQHVPTSAVSLRKLRKEDTTKMRQRIVREAKERSLDLWSCQGAFYFL